MNFSKRPRSLFTYKACLLLIVLTAARPSSALQCVDLFARTERLDRPRLFSMLEKIIIETSEKELSFFFVPALIRKIKSGVPFEGLIGQHIKDQIDERLSRDDSGPTPLELRGENVNDAVTRSRLVVVGDGVFLDGFFLNHGLSNPGTTGSLGKKQPWMEVTGSGTKLRLHREGGQKALLDRWLRGHKGSAVTLYRGITTPYERPMMNLLRSLKTTDPSVRERQDLLQAFYEAVFKVHETKGTEKEFASAFRARFSVLNKSLESVDSTNREAVKKHLIHLFMQLNLGLQRDALFFSPNLETAKKWYLSYRREGVVSVKIPKEQLKEMSEREEIYVGIENTIEVALVSERAQTLFLISGTPLSAYPPRPY